jgi:hypothetical protein
MQTVSAELIIKLNFKNWSIILTHVHFGQSFCAEYASAYLPDKKHTLFLQTEGKTTLWETMLDLRSTDKLRRISRGWKQFSRENALELGDVCLFKLEDTDTSILKMTAYVIRKSLTEL